MELPPRPRHSPRFTSQNLIDTRYINKDERKVHVWATSEGGIYIVAGSWSDDSLPISVFYRWLDLIIIPTEKKENKKEKHIVLVAFNGDPTEMGDSSFDTAVELLQESPGNILQRSSDELIPAGNYILFRQTENSSELERFLPQLFTPVIFGRKPPKDAKRAQSKPDNIEQKAGNGKENKSAKNSSHKKLGKPKRSKETPQAVRDRDMQCRVTGLSICPRVRGENRTALEVAHIIPLIYIYTAGEVVNQAISHLIDKPEIIDDPGNAILLRSDVHAYLDAQQFSFIRVAGTNELQMIRFERNGAPGLERFFQERRKLLPPNQQKSDPDIDSINMLLIDHHLRHCLLTTVAGFGPTGKQEEEVKKEKEIVVAEKGGKSKKKKKKKGIVVPSASPEGDAQPEVGGPGPSKGKKRL